MIHKPWSRGTGSYTQLDDKADIAAFMKRKRKMQMVIFTEDGDLLPVKCSRCDEMITDDGNRVDIDPKTKTVKPYHYDCSWENVMAAVYKLGSVNEDIHGLREHTLSEDELRY